jgi:hypothetical protein
MNIQINLHVINPTNYKINNHTYLILIPAC